jgi:hypothetical protein
MGDILPPRIEPLSQPKSGPQEQPAPKPRPKAIPAEKLAPIPDPDIGAPDEDENHNLDEMA